MFPLTDIIVILIADSKNNSSKSTQDLRGLYFQLVVSSMETKRMIMITNNNYLKVIDIASFNKSLKATWIQKYMDPENHSKWKRLFDSELERNGGKAILYVKRKSLTV